MPSLRTRQAFDRTVIATAEAALGEAAAAVADATETLTDIQSGTLDLDAITVGGQRFIYDGVGDLIVEP